MNSGCRSAAKFQLTCAPEPHIYVAGEWLGGCNTRTPSTSITFEREKMAPAVTLNSVRRRITQKIGRLQPRNHNPGYESHQLWDGGSCHWSKSELSHFRNPARNYKTWNSKGFITDASGGLDVVRISNNGSSYPQAERLLQGLSQLGRRIATDIRQVLKLPVEPCIASTSDLRWRSQAWKVLVQRQYCHHPSLSENVTFLELGKLLRAASLTLARYQIIPRVLTFAVGNATFAQQSFMDSTPYLGLNGPSRECIPHSVWIAAMVASLVEGIILILRAAYLAALFTPAIVMAAFVDVMGEEFRGVWLRLVHHTLELAGAAFIKWGQWAATRPDLFPRDLCSELSQLHTKAPSHDFEQTRKTVEHAFHRRIDEIFEEFEEEPVASGSIAQVHRAILKPQHFGRRAKHITVAVKVRHPGVSQVIRRDFAIIKTIAKISTFLPGFSWLRLDDSVQQFAVFMLTQVDLAREAAHLGRFNYNFRRWRDISFPVPLYPLVHPEVLVETFENGESVANFLEKPELVRVNKTLAELGTHTLLKMLLVDNFIHADMHPGNILVRLNDSSRKKFFRSKPHVILLDVGMTAELPQEDRHTLLRFFQALSDRDGRTAAECTLKFSRSQGCPNPAGFITAIENCFKGWAGDKGDSLHVGDCMQELLEVIRQHKVNVDGDVCTVMVTTLVLEGWQRKLDPDLNMMDLLQNQLLQSTWATSLSSVIGESMSP